MYNIDEYTGKNHTYYQHLRTEMLAFIPKNSKTILEIGCGNGAFGKLVKKETSCEYWGIEPDMKSANEANSNLDKFINSLFDENINLPQNYFDCIIFNDVIEHLLYPESTLLLCKKYLKPNGKIISSIPNMRHAPYLYRLFYLGEFEYEDFGIMDKTHFRFFTIKSIAKMFERCGYKLTKQEGINPSVPSKMKILIAFANFIFKGKFNDTRFQQIATVAELIGEN